MGKDAVLKIQDEKIKGTERQSSVCRAYPSSTARANLTWISPAQLQYDKINCKPLPTTIMKLRETNASYLES